MGSLSNVTVKRGLAILGLVGAVVLGRWWGERDLRVLLDMPQGGLYLSARHQAVFQKLQPQTVSWLRIPDPAQARLMRLFGAPSPTGTTTTTMPPGPPVGPGGAK